eukprot:CAMPEP_0201569206 /NCGR_PEP_ID=MMETSP0190_2-20130828/10757_1 /ASSEMBLY_ACC=CAM_ASM_000263 /TAXON_ID=37353 /ORGANISM="Rosalina sp." /LENGTH=81 /DNA_ID=CAMNT_0047991273 /DNA_START=443 /DNA_END=685 /DNA_ORIENTATION=-
MSSSSSSLIVICFGTFSKGRNAGFGALIFFFFVSFSTTLIIDAFGNTVISNFDGDPTEYIDSAAVLVANEDGASAMMFRVK